MPELPAVGSRVSIRYRVPDGLTDVIGHLEAVSPSVRVRTKSDGVIDLDPDSIVTVRELSHRTVRNSEIRALEQAAALAWPGLEQHWVNGWFLRAAHGHTSRANSAVPLELSAILADLPEIIDWYRRRDLPAWLALPERLLRVAAQGVKENRVMVCDNLTGSPGSEVTFLDVPDAAWLTAYEREVPVDVLTAVVDGEVTFASITGATVGRGAVTTAPDGTRWLGISSVRVADARRRRGHARTICAALLNWGAEHGATRCYVQVLADNSPAVSLYESLGFGLHHRVRYVDAESLLP
ncbi:MAG: GNAT family N-acetyltransferase [Mycobacterium sp.]